MSHALDAPLDFCSVGSCESNAYVELSNTREATLTLGCQHTRMLHEPISKEAHCFTMLVAFGFSVLLLIGRRPAPYKRAGGKPGQGKGATA
jgi:hypothetical protein